MIIIEEYFHKQTLVEGFLMIKIHNEDCRDTMKRMVCDSIKRIENTVVC